MCIGTRHHPIDMPGMSYLSSCLTGPFWPNSGAEFVFDFSNINLATEFDFVKLPILLWSARIQAVQTRFRNSPFVRLFRDGGAAVTQIVLLGQPESARAELFRAFLAGNMRITRMYQCDCGEYYGIGECGMAMERQACPGCRGGIGGGNHQMDRNHRQIDQHEMQRLSQPQPGFSADANVNDVGYRLRNFSPLQWRVSQILQLFSLIAVGTHAQNFQTHFDKLRNLLGLSMRETSLFLAHLIVNLPAEALQLPACDAHHRDTNEQVFLRGLEQAVPEVFVANAASPQAASAAIVQAMNESYKQAALAMGTSVEDPLELFRNSYIAGLAPDEARRLYAPGRLLIPALEADERSNAAVLQRTWDGLVDAKKLDFPLVKNHFASTDITQYWAQFGGVEKHFENLMAGIALVFVSQNGRLAEDDYETTLQQVFGSLGMLGGANVCTLAEFIAAWNHFADVRAQHECQAVQIPRAEGTSLVRHFVLSQGGNVSVVFALLQAVTKIHNDMVDGLNMRPASSAVADSFHPVRTIEILSTDLLAKLERVFNMGVDRRDGVNGVDVSKELLSEELVNAQQALVNKPKFDKLARDVEGRLPLDNLHNSTVQAGDEPRVLELLRVFEELLSTEFTRGRGGPARFSLAKCPAFRFRPVDERVSMFSTGAEWQEGLPGTLELELREELEALTKAKQTALTELLQNLVFAHEGNHQISPEASLWALSSQHLLGTAPAELGELVPALSRGDVLLKHLKAYTDLVYESFTNEEQVLREFQRRTEQTYEEPLTDQQKTEIQTFIAEQNRARNHGAGAEQQGHQDLIKDIRISLREMMPNMPKNAPNTPLREWCWDLEDEAVEGIPETCMVRQLVAVYRLFIGEVEE